MAVEASRRELDGSRSELDGDGDVEFDVTVSSQKNVKVRHSKEKWTAAVAAHLRRCCSRGLVSDVDVVVALRAMASRWQ